MSDNKSLQQKVKDLEEKIELMTKIQELESRLRALENKDNSFPIVPWTIYGTKGDNVVYY